MLKTPLITNFDRFSVSLSVGTHYPSPNGCREQIFFSPEITDNRTASFRQSSAKVAYFLIRMLLQISPTTSGICSKTVQL